MEICVFSSGLLNFFQVLIFLSPLSYDYILPTNRNVIDLGCCVAISLHTVNSVNTKERRLAEAKTSFSDDMLSPRICFLRKIWTGREHVALNVLVDEYKSLANMSQN